MGKIKQKYFLSYFESSGSVFGQHERKPSDLPEQRSEGICVHLPIGCICMSGGCSALMLRQNLLTTQGKLCLFDCLWHL